MKNTPIELEVIAFVAELSHHPIDGINNSTSLFGDIGITGKASKEFLAAFQKKFQIDMTSYQPHHFESEKYVSWTPQMWVHLEWICQGGRKVTPESRAGLVPITIGDLIESAVIRRWTIYPKINA